MPSYFFDDTTEGLRKARRLLAISWAKYFSQLIAFFVAPIIVLLFRDRWIGLVGFLAVVAVCVLDVLPQMVAVIMDENLNSSNCNLAFEITCMSAPLCGAALLLFQEGDLQAVGAWIWIIGHLIDLRSPPRIEKITS